MIAARALWFYAGKLVWPADLAVIYPLWKIDTGDLFAWVYLAGAVAVAALLWFGRRRIGRGPLAGALLFAVTLAPALGFVDYGYMQFSLVADRFQYLAGIGALAVLIGGAAYGVGKLPAAYRVGAGAAAAAVVLLLGGSGLAAGSRLPRRGHAVQPRRRTQPRRARRPSEPRQCA